MQDFEEDGIDRGVRHVTNEFDNDPRIEQIYGLTGCSDCIEFALLVRGCAIIKLMVVNGPGCEGELILLFFSTAYRMSTVSKKF